MSAPVPDDLPVLEFADQAAWRAWLLEHHETAPGVWIKMAKKSSGIASVDWKQAVEEALCAGWIDGQKRSLDESHFLQRFTPRRPRSTWSQVNVEHVERLTAQGRMLAAGNAQVEQARADGRWVAAYPASFDDALPPELDAALAANPAARVAFDALKASERYSICWRIHNAKRAETRARKVAEVMAQLTR